MVSIRVLRIAALVVGVLAATPNGAVQGQPGADFLKKGRAVGAASHSKRGRAKEDSTDASPFGFVGAPPTAEDWKLLTDMGVKWIQFSIPWAYAEPRPGVFWYSTGGHDYGYDTWVHDAVQHGVRVVIKFHTAPPWANAGSIGSFQGTEPRNAMYPPDDAHWDAFEKFVGIVVDRFRPLGVHDYEMWTEPEASMFQRWNTSAYPKVEAYQKLLKHAHAAIRLHDPDGILLASGDVPVNMVRWSEEGYTAGAKYLNKPDPYAGRRLDGIGKGFVDVISGHFYWTDYSSSPRQARPPEERNPGRGDKTLSEMVQDAKEVAGKRPVWISEVGYATAPTQETPDRLAVSEEEQANFLVRYYMVALSSGVQKVFWYAWRDTPTSSYGILHADGTPKPAYKAYRTMATQLAGLKFDHVLDSGTHWLLRFTGSRTVLVAWKTSGGDETRSIAVPWPRARQVSRDGTETAADVQGGKASVTLHGEEPVYLEEMP